MSENAVETGTLGSQVVVFPPNGQTVETNQPDAEQEADISSEESPEEEEERRKHECVFHEFLFTYLFDWRLLYYSISLNFSNLLD